MVFPLKYFKSIDTASWNFVATSENTVSLGIGGFFLFFSNLEGVSNLFSVVLKIFVELFWFCNPKNTKKLVAADGALW